MAITVIHEEKKTKCENCKVGLTYTTQDEAVHRSRRYMFIKCPRCEHEVVTTKLQGYGSSFD